MLSCLWRPLDQLSGHAVALELELFSPNPKHASSIASNIVADPVFFSDLLVS